MDMVRESLQGKELILLEGKEIKEVVDSLMQVRLDIRELMVEVRSLKDLQEKVNIHETKLAKLEDKADAAHTRLDKVDKVFWFMFITVFGGLILSVMSFITVHK